MSVTLQQPPSVQMDDAYLPLAALAKYSGLSVRTLRTYLAHPVHPLPHYRPGGKIVVRRSEFDRWMGAFRATEPPRLKAIVADALKGL